MNKSGCYTCEICKEFFTAHNRIFLSKEKKYACPFCNSTQFIEHERNNRMLDSEESGETH
jgi:DNA-directed RNA polymerase subunit RPC12/RpoP